MSETPFFFDLPPERSCGGPVFGWYSAGSGSRDVGVVLCSPFGREEVSAYRTMRHLAGCLAASGFATLRFDWPGTGNSAGDHTAADLPATFVQAIHSATDELKRRCGVSRFAFVGMRLGALLALQAAMGRDDIVALATIAPVLSGRAFVRELRALAGAAQPNDGATAASASQDGDLESGGFVLSAQTCRALSQLNHESPATRPAPRMLVIERDDMASKDRWFKQLTSLGIDVDRQRLPGYAELMLDPHRSQLPTAMIDATCTWFDRLDAFGSRRLPSSLDQRSIEGPALIDDVLERPVDIAAGESRLFGVLTQPGNGQARHGLVLANAGGVRTIGPSRLYATLARRLASAGWVVLRFDLAGLGDSPARESEVENVIYPDAGPVDVAHSVHWLRATTGVASCHVAGLCAGAYHAFKSALRGAAVDGVVVINPLTFFHKDDEQLRAGLSESAALRDLERYRSTTLSLELLSRLVRGKVHVRHAARVMSHMMAGKVWRPARGLARVVGVDLQEDLGRELRTLIDRDVSLDFVFAEGEPGEALLRLQGARIASRFIAERKIRLHHIAGGDHTFSTSGPRDVAIERLVDILAASVAASAASSAVAAHEHSR